MNNRLQPLLSRLGIKPRISYGYTFVVAIILLATVIGLSFCESYREQTAAKLTQDQAEEHLLRQLQISVLETRIAQQDLSNKLHQRKQFDIQLIHAKMSKVAEELEQLNEYYLQINLTQSETVKKTLLETSALKYWIQKYEGLVDRDRQKLEANWLDINPFKVNLKTTQVARMSLLEFNQNQVAIAFSNLTKELTQLIEHSQQEQQEAAIILERIEALLLQIIRTATLLSVMIAVAITTNASRAIAYPLKSTTQVARRVTEENQLALQKESQSPCEQNLLPSASQPLPSVKVGGLTTSVNPLVQGVANDTQELQQTQTEFERFFNLSFALFCIAGFDGYFKRFNTAFETTLGYTQAELLSTPFLNLVHPQERVATLANVRKLLAGVTVSSFENRYRCQDGSYKWLSWTVVPFAPEKLMYAVAHDITEHKQALESLRESKHFQEEIAQTTPNILYTYDLIEQRNIYSNRQIAETLGYIPEAITQGVALKATMGANILPDLLHPDDLSASLEQINRIATIDITERQQKEEELRQSEARYRELANRETLLNRLASQIRNSLDLETILETAVLEIRNLLQLDRCFFFWHRPDTSPPHWEVVQEAKNPDLASFINNCVPITEIQTLMAKANNPEIKIITIGNTRNLHNP
ncbi:PAS domain S-box protein [Microcoleus sp. FACHB-SPT15]|uniref:PAS domain-containing protein n=1 Tax=Microcoleus sp. FACHB-SPT15 TaxID=2692830 RepID=UPI0017870536|nr:PAS domain S-box protein [Microcoleus sp. FACHB-SPT15]MBD1809141.1 PAS domain S-box protein [Microcoleus sp. FACHB-SPT15]